MTLSNRIRLAWALTVASYTGLNDVVYGVTVSGRNAAVPGVEQMTGATLATYPLRVRLQPSGCVADELRAIQRDAVATLPFEQLGLQHISALGEEAARACRFQSLLVVQQPEAVEMDQAEPGILSPAPDVDGEPAGGTHALTVLCTPSSSQSGVKVEGLYDARVFPETQTRRALNLFGHFLAELTSAEHDQRVADLNRISEEDQKQLAVWNREVHPRLPVCVHQLIEEHAQSQPQAPAIAAWNGELTYADLDKLSSQLTARLVACGVRRETFVPLCMHKSRWVAVAMLAVAKAGGAFILLDPSHPIPRLQHICHDSKAPVVISSTATLEVARQLGCYHVLPVENTTGNIDSDDCSDDDSLDDVMLVPSVAQPEDALYAVFTSGSTGKPKGVVVEHGAFATNAVVTGSDYLLNKHSRVLQFASHAFDATVLDYLFPLVCGGCVCVPEETASRDDLGRVINDLGVNWAALTPSVARILDPDSLPRLQVLALVGEAAKAVDVATWADRVRLLNAYGPAECSVVSTIQTRINKHDATDDAAFPHNPANIGRSVAGATWLVDPDDHDKLVPIGAVGELLMQGPMVGRGYLGNPDQTAASFIAFPPWLRRLRPQDHSGKMYKTGDLVRYSPSDDGSLDYIGRKDNQVKLRGQRIELGEVEAQTGKCLPPGTDVVVDIITPREPNAQPMLVAFVWNGPAGSASQQTRCQGHSELLSVPQETFRTTAVQAESALRETTLPRHMIPALFILLTHLPLSLTGKANRRCIKEHASSLTLRELEQYRGNVSSPAGSSQCKRPPASDAERTVLQLVARVLQADHTDIGIDDNFFHVGGNSLSAMAISTQARRMGLDVSVVDIFTHPQLSVLAAAVTGRNSPNTHEAEGPPAPFALLSQAGISQDSVINGTLEQCGFTQHQRHLIDDIYPCTPMQEGLFSLTMRQSGAYVTKLALDLSEDIDITRFRAVLEAVCQANPILRTRIVPAGAIGQLHQVVINSRSASVIYGPTSPSQDKQSAFHIRPGGPLARIDLVVLPQERCRVVFRLHHSIYDGISIRLVLNQLEEAYSNQTPLSLRPYSSFVKYCILAPDSADFWKQELADASTPAFPPVPMKGSALQSPSSTEEYIPFQWDASAGVPVAAALKLAWGIIVSQYTGEKDVIFGTVVSGRSASVPYIEQLSGPTIATVPFRVRHDPTMVVQDALGEVQERTTRMVPFEQTGLQRIRLLGYDDACRFQNLLLIQLPEGEDAPESALYCTAPPDPEDEQPVFDTYPLTMVCTPMADSLSVRAIYDQGVIDGAFVHKVLAQFLHVVTHLNSFEHRQHPLHDMPQVSMPDLAQFRTWNGSLPQSEDRCVHELVGDTAAALPLAPAICAWDGDFNYTQLDRLASLLACQLLGLSGLDPNSSIPIYFEKSRWTAVAALAVLKTGRTIMLLDTAYPMQRVEEICQATQPTVIISSVNTASRASSLAPNNITLSDEHAAWLEKHRHQI